MERFMNSKGERRLVDRGSRRQSNWRRKQPENAPTGPRNSHSSSHTPKIAENEISSFTKSFSTSFRISMDPFIRNYIEDQNEIEEHAHSESWLALPEVPTSEEIASSTHSDVLLTANKMKGKWKSVDRYLKAHYDLLREDTAAPLRDAVAKCRRDPQTIDDVDVAIYEKVYIIGFTFSQLGIAARIKFSTSRSKYRIPWKSSKRLVSGSLIALSKAEDNFIDTCVVGIVAARPLKLVEQVVPEVDIYFSKVEDINIDPQQQWVMVEARQGYFEAHRHTMRALQKLSIEKFPFANNVCSLSPITEAPQYIRERHLMKLSAAANEGKESFYEQVNVLNQWPTMPDNNLDESQWLAIHQIITKSLAIIQGPPGTGKTHVSRIALQIMLENRLSEDPPIIVSAQTNHALDQLLCHIAEFEKNYIRLGGRSSNVEVKKRALYEIRQLERIGDVKGGLLIPALKEWKAKTKHLCEILRPLSEAGSKIKSYPIKALVELEVLSAEQGDSLVREAEDWITEGDEEPDPIQFWLGHKLIPFEIKYFTEHFGFGEPGGEEDLEYEYTGENDAEYGVGDDEDIELLQGDWCPIKDCCINKASSLSSFTKAQKVLDLVQDLHNIPQSSRLATFLLLQRRLKEAVQTKFRAAAVEYQQIIARLRIGKWERDAHYLKKARVVGMTTTGLSKYRPLIASLKPKIILIEEAAEIIEAPVTVACMESIEHLILVGDHQQLRGHCNVSELEGEPYHLDISLFERLVNNELAHVTLQQQRRMNPTLRNLISPLYPKLEDHPTVVNRPTPCWGMGKVKLFFFNHQWPERKDSSFSIVNEQEAKFIAGFYRYLILNGVDSHKITVLTFYQGQRKCILTELKSDPQTQALNHIVKTIDSYQGEENSIVLLSLVRNNVESNIGFVQSENRACVALSRAKFGLYLFGNADLIASCSSFWAQVISNIATNPFRIGARFPTCCEKHKKVVFKKDPHYWNGNEGGCDLRCGEKLLCGHVCKVRCHPYSHDLIKCRQKCSKTLDCGHECRKQCYQPCSCKCPEAG